MQMHASSGTTESTGNAFPLYDPISNSPNSSLYPRMPRLLWESNDLRNGILQVIGWRQGALAVAFDAQSIHKLAEMTWSHVVGTSKGEFDQSGADYKYTDSVPFITSNLSKISHNPADPYFTKLGVPGANAAQGITVPIIKDIKQSQLLLQDFSSSLYINSACILEARDCAMNYATCRVTLHMRYPAATLKFRKLASPPLFSEGELNDALFSPFMDDSTSSIIPGLFSGWLTMDAARYTVPLLSTDPAIPITPLVGLWVRALDTVTGDDLSIGELLALQTNGLPKWADMMLSHPLVRSALLRYEEGVDLGEKYFPRPSKEDEEIENMDGAASSSSVATAEAIKPNTRALIALFPPPKVLAHRQKQRAELLASGELGSMYRASTSLYDTSTVVHVEAEIDWPTLKKPSFNGGTGTAPTTTTNHSNPEEKSWVMLDPTLSLTFRRIPGDELREMEASMVAPTEPRVSHTVGGFGETNRPVPQVDVSSSALEYIWTLEHCECDLGALLPLSHTSVIWSMYPPSVKWDAAALLQKLYPEANEEGDGDGEEKNEKNEDEEDTVEGTSSKTTDASGNEENTTHASTGMAALDDGVDVEKTVSSSIDTKEYTSPKQATGFVFPTPARASGLVASPTARFSVINASSVGTEDTRKDPAKTIPHREVTSSELRHSRLRVPPASAYYAAFGVKSAEAIQSNTAVSDALLIKSRNYHTSPVLSPPRRSRPWMEQESSVENETMGVTRALTYTFPTKDRTSMESAHQSTFRSPTTTFRTRGSTGTLPSFRHDASIIDENITQRFQKIREDQLRRGVRDKVGNICESLQKVDSWLLTQKITDPASISTSTSSRTPPHLTTPAQATMSMSRVSTSVPRSSSPLSSFTRPLFVLPDLSPGSTSGTDTQLHETQTLLSNTRNEDALEQFPRPVRNDPPLPSIRSPSSFSTLLRSQQLLSPQASIITTTATVTNHPDRSRNTQSPVLSPINTTSSVARTTAHFATTGNTNTTSPRTPERVHAAPVIKSPVQIMALTLRDKLLNTSKNLEHLLGSPKPSDSLRTIPLVSSDHKQGSPRFASSQIKEVVRATSPVQPPMSPQQRFMQTMRDKYDLPTAPVMKSTAPSLSTSEARFHTTIPRNHATTELSDNNDLSATIQNEIESVMRRLEALGDLSSLSLDSIQRHIHESTPVQPSTQPFLEKTIVPGETPIVKNSSPAYFAEQWTRQLSPEPVHRSPIANSTHSTHPTETYRTPTTRQAMSFRSPDDTSVAREVLKQVKPKFTSPKISAYSSTVPRSSFVPSTSFQRMNRSVSEELSETASVLSGASTEKTTTPSPVDDAVAENTTNKETTAPAEAEPTSATAQATASPAPALAPSPQKKQESSTPAPVSTAVTLNRPPTPQKNDAGDATSNTSVAISEPTGSSSEPTVTEPTEPVGNPVPAVATGRMTGTAGVFVEYSNDQIKIRYTPKTEHSQPNAPPTATTTTTTTTTTPFTPQKNQRGPAATNVPHVGGDIGPLCTSPRSPNNVIRSPGSNTPMRTPGTMRSPPATMTPRRPPSTTTATTTTTAVARSPSNYPHLARTPQRTEKTGDTGVPVIVSPVKPATLNLDFSPVSTSPSFQKTRSTVIKGMQVPKENPFSTPLARRFSTPKSSRAPSSQGKDTSASNTSSASPKIRSDIKDSNSFLAPVRIQFDEHLEDQTDLLNSRNTQLHIPSPPSISFPITATPEKPMSTPSKRLAGTSGTKTGRAMSPAVVPVPEILKSGNSASANISATDALKHMDP